MASLWTKQQEKDFFYKSLRDFASPEQVFYRTEDGKYYAYWPKGYKGRTRTLQSRNALIGAYTEKWCRDLFEDIAVEVGGYSVQGVICDQIALSARSPADIAICKTESKEQSPQDILLLIEVKMSIVWNWELRYKGTLPRLVCVGDYTTHRGNPSFLRSDTMLKAIGKSVNIRVSGLSACRIPILIVGNTPITTEYSEKVDHLKRSGVIQGFWSVNPCPVDAGEFIMKTTYEGFYTFEDYSELKERTLELLREERLFFSSMKTEKELGKIIEIANRETSLEAKGKKFLELIREMP